MTSSETGQGSIEYLVILSASLTASTVIVLLATTMFTGYSDPANVAQDKNVCATFGIELLNYNERYDDLNTLRNDLSINHYGSFKRCSGATSLSNVESACKIRQKTDKNACFIIYTNVSEGSEGCYIEASTNCF